MKAFIDDSGRFVWSCSEGHTHSTSTLRLHVEMGALTSIPRPEARGLYPNGFRHWFITLRENPLAQSGYDVQKWPTARGRFFYMVPSPLPILSVCQYGSDRVEIDGMPVERIKNRWHGILLDATSTHLLFAEALTARHAFQMLKEIGPTLKFDLEKPDRGFRL